MRIVTITLATLLCAFSIAGAGEPAKRSAELQVLERFIGQWTTVVTIKATGDKIQSTQDRKWSKEGKFVLSEEMNLLSKTESHFLITYDPNAKLYRSCFIEEGNAVVILGTWNNVAQTMKWIAKDANGGTHVGASRFLDKDHVEWSMVVTGPDGKVLIEMSAKQARRK